MDLKTYHVASHIMWQDASGSLSGSFYMSTDLIGKIHSLLNFNDEYETELYLTRSVPRSKHNSSRMQEKIR